MNKTESGAPLCWVQHEQGDVAPPSTGVGRLHPNQSIARGELWAALTFYFRIHSFDLLQQVPLLTWATAPCSHAPELQEHGIPRANCGQRHPQLYCHPHTAKEKITAANLTLHLQAAEGSFWSLQGTQRGTGPHLYLSVSPGVDPEDFRPPS